MTRRVYDVLTTAQTPSLALVVHADGTWSLRARTGPPAHLGQATYRVHLRGPWGTIALHSDRLGVADITEEERESALGPARVLTVHHQPAPEGVQLLWQAHLYAQQPYITCAVGVRVVGPGFHLDRLVPLALHPPRGRVQTPGLEKGWTFFVDGWHSWSFAGVLTNQQRQPRSRAPMFDAPMAYDLAHPPPKAPGHFLSHTVGVLTGTGEDASSLVVGWTRQWEHVGLVEIRGGLEPGPALWAWGDGEGIPLPPEGVLWSEPLLVQFVLPGHPDPLGDFARALGQMSGARVVGDAPVGWCTWYQFFANVRQEDVLRNLRMAREKRPLVPVNLVQLDDGYETAVGDWLSPKETFSQGLEWLAQEIRAAACEPGLWMAPFIAVPRARVVRKHPEWLLRDARGRPVRAGYLWGTFARGLDVTHPGVQDYVQEVVHTAVHHWGYSYLKLDFLYAAVLPARYHRPGLTRPQVLRRGLELIREAAGEDVFLLGCGCPLGPAVGLVDAMRVGPDIAPHWWPRLYGMTRVWRQNPTKPAAINAIRNTLTRAAYHRRLWWNDPDCVLARVRDTRLSAVEVQSWLSVVGLSGGMVVFSDDLEAIPPERWPWMAALLPVQPEAGRPLDLLTRTLPEVVAVHLERAWGHGVTVGVFNWQERPRALRLDFGALGLEAGQPYHTLDFWSGRYERVTGGSCVFEQVPAHGGHVVGIKPVLSIPHLAGSTFHITQGGEVREWDWEPPRLQFRVSLSRRAEGTVLLGTAGWRVVGVPQDVRVSPVAEDVLALQFSVDGERTIVLTLAQEGGG